MKYSLDGETKAHRIYKLEKSVEEFKVTKKIPSIQLADDPRSKNSESKSTVFACAKCQRKLFTTDNEITHEKGLCRLGVRLICSSMLSCDYHFVEPIKWMRNVVEESAGELKCPDCTTVIGRWSWHGLDCSCQTLVTPAFCIMKECVSASFELPAPSLPPRHCE
jgi:dual specificity phosphatase 12